MRGVPGAQPDAGSGSPCRRRLQRRRRLAVWGRARRRRDWPAALEALRRARRSRRPARDAASRPDGDPLLGADADVLIVERGGRRPGSSGVRPEAGAVGGARPRARGEPARCRGRRRIARGACAIAGLDPYADDFIAARRTDPDRRRPRLGRTPRAAVLRRLPASRPRGDWRRGGGRDAPAWLPDGLVRGAAIARCRAARTAAAHATSIRGRWTSSASAARARRPRRSTSDMPGATSSAWTSARSRSSSSAPDGGDRFAAGVDVAGARTLTVEEIVARHQAAAARQAAAIDTLDLGRARWR